jgi:hypothetical protein
MSTNTDIETTTEEEFYEQAPPLNPFEDRDIVVPAWRLEAVQARIEKLRRKEKKLLGEATFELKVVGQAAFGISIKPTPFDLKEFKEACFAAHQDREALRKVHGAHRAKHTREEPAVVIELTGRTPEVPGGWTLVGVVTRLGDACIVTQVPDLERELDLAEFRSADRLRCDHCQAARFRKEHFVVVSEAGELKVVGRNCLQDFLGGHSPERLIAWAKLLRYFSTALDRSHEDEDRDYFRDHSGLLVAEFVAIVCAQSREHGFITAKAARAAGDESGLSSTKSGALDQYWALRFDPKRGHVEPTSDDWAEAAAAIEWAKNLEGRSDFDYNLKTIAEAGSIPQNAIHRLAGIAAYLPQAVKRAQEREVAREREKAERPVSQHVGEIKKRQQLTLTKVGEYQTEGDYGTTWIEKFETPEGSKVTWFASNPHIVKGAGWVEGKGYEEDRSLAIGESAVVKATPKKHDTFRGEAVTVVTRVVLVRLVAGEEKEAC